jgi:transposase
MARRRTFSQEYKHEAVQLACSSDEPVSQVARELGISPNLLSRWCREAKAEGGQAFPGPGRPKDEELAHLKRELARVKKERDFLQEAAGSSTGRCNTCL